MIAAGIVLMILSGGIILTVLLIGLITWITEKIDEGDWFTLGFYLVICMLILGFGLYRLGISQLGR